MTDREVYSHVTHEILSRLQNQKRNGAEIQASCPFHKDKTPSFSFNMQKGVFICFSCNEKGNWKRLASLLNIDIPNIEYNRISSKSQELNSVKCIEDFFCDESVEYWNTRGVTKEDLNEIQNVGWHRETKQPIFFFRNDDGKIFWHVHKQWQIGASSKSLWFNPGANDDQHDTLYICEGEKDAVVMQIAGFNARGIAGAGMFSDVHLQKISAKNVKICFDYDKTGRNNAISVSKLIKDSADNINVKCINWNNIKESYRIKLRKKYDLNDLFHEHRQTFYNIITNDLSFTDADLLKEKSKFDLLDEVKNIYDEYYPKYERVLEDEDFEKQTEIRTDLLNQIQLFIKHNLKQIDTIILDNIKVRLDSYKDWKIKKATVDDIYKDIINGNGNGKYTEEQVSSYKEVKDKITKILQSKYLYDIISNKFYNINLNHYYDRFDFKAFIKESVIGLAQKYDLDRMVSRLKEIVYVEYIQNADNFLHGGFKLELGVNNLKDLGGNIMDINNKKYIVNKEKTPYFNIPSFKTENDNMWKPLTTLFCKPDIALYTLKLFIANLKLSYLGKQRANPIFPVIHGKQGIGKDYYLFRFLTSPIPDEYKVADANADLITDEKNYKQLEGRIILLFPEMERFEKTDVNAIKSFITRPYLSYRVMYSHDNDAPKNLVNLIGTTNKQFHEIYKDTTGERRFVFLKLKKNLELKDIIEVVSFYNYDASELYTSVDECKDFSKEIEIIRKFQESEMRYRSTEEVFLDETLPTIEDSIITTSELFNMFNDFLNDIGEHKYRTNKIFFGRQIRPLMESREYDYDSNHRYYKKNDIQSSQS